MQENTFVIETTYQIKYTNEKPIPISEVVDSLLALEKLLRRTPKFLERHYKNIEVVSTDVYVSSIETGSVIEDFVIRYVFKGKKNYDDAKALGAKIIGDSEVVRTIVAMGVGAMICYGVVLALPGDAPKPAIEAYNNTIINIGADVNFSAADIKATLEAMPNKKQLSKDALQAVRPAKLEKDAEIEIEGFDNLDMPSEYIEAVPLNYEAPVPDEKSTKYSNVEIFIYASDRDNSDRGWGGIVPSLFEHRVKFVLADTVDPAKLHGRIKARANLEVHEKYVREKKKYVVTKVELHLIN